MAETLNWDKIRKTEISLTTHCQALCPLCGRTDPITLKKVDWLPLKHFPFEKLKKTVLDIRKANPRLEIINLCGDYGDPMMHPDIENIIEFLITNKFFVEISTNGGLRDSSWYRKLGEKYHSAKLTIIFSIDGIDAETNSKYRIGVDFKKAWNNMIAFSETCYKNTCVWDFIAFTYNLDQLETAAELANKYNIMLKFKLNDRDWEYQITDSKRIKRYNKFVENYEKR